MKETDGVSRRALFNIFKDSWKRSTPPTPSRQLSPEEQAYKKNTRREAIPKIVFGGLGIAVAGERGTSAAINTIWKAKTPEHAQIEGLDGQEEELRKSDSLVLFFGGSTRQETKSIAKKVLPALKQFGPVGEVSYANDKFDIKGIADQIEALRTQYPNLKKLSAYGHSLGTQVFAQVLEELERRGKPTKIKYLLMDCTPPDYSFVDYGQFFWLVSTGLRASRGDAFLTMMINKKVYGEAFKPGAAPPELAAEQAGIVQEGMRWMRYLSNKVIIDNETANNEDDKAKVAFFTPEDPKNDDITIAELSREEMPILFPEVEVVPLKPIDEIDKKSKNLHASPDHHPKSYTKALNWLQIKWGIPGKKIA